MINDLKNTSENIQFILKGIQPKCYLLTRRVSIKSAPLSQNPLHGKFKFKILWISVFRLSKYCNR